MLLIRKKQIFQYSLLLFLLLFFYACNKQGDNIVDPGTDPVKNQRGEIVGEPKFWMNTPSASIKILVETLKLDPGLIGSHSVNVYSLNYRTIDKDNNSVIASGSVYYPVGSETFPVLSYHHGTVFNRTEVSSVNPMLNQQEAFVMASKGYVTFVPDYLGYGISDMIHPYHNAKLSASSVIDFIRAGKQFCKNKNISLNDKLFLGGYSEGGFVTLAVQKEIETSLQKEFTVTASAPLAGAYDLIETGKFYFGKEIVFKPAFLGFLLTSYNHVYKWNKLNDIFNEPYAAKMKSLYDGTHFDDNITSNLNDTIKVLVKQSFIDSFMSSASTPEKEKFIENSLLNWTPKAPIQMVHGDSDNVVPYINSSKAFDSFKSKGANVKLMTIPGGTHASSVLPGVIYSLAFFEQYK